MSVRPFEEITCSHCGWKKQVAYPSLARRNPTAPSEHDLRAMQEALTIELAHHQNQERCHISREKRGRAIGRFT